MKDQIAETEPLKRDAEVKNRKFMILPITLSSYHPPYTSKQVILCNMPNPVKGWKESWAESRA